jgi:hypothetical protein
MAVSSVRLSRLRDSVAGRVMRPLIPAIMAFAGQVMKIA